MADAHDSSPPMFGSRGPSSFERERREAELRSTLGQPLDESDAEATVLLLDRARGGDKDAEGRIFERYHDRLARYVRIEMRARRAVDADDIVQEACLGLLRSLDTFEYRGKDSLYAYLKRIACNLMLMEARKGGGRAPTTGEPAELEIQKRFDALPSPSMLARSAELQRILEESMAELPPAMREVLLNRQVLQAPSKVVAEWMGLADEHQVNRLAHQARTRWLAIAGPRLDAWLEAE